MRWIRMHGIDEKCTDNISDENVVATNVRMEVRRH
jgi:hypothetical protein